MDIKNQRHLRFVNKPVQGGFISRECISDTGDYLSDYLMLFRDINDLDDIIEMLDHAINGDFDRIDDPEIGGEWHFIEITPTRVDYRAMEPPFKIVTTFKLADFRKLLWAWKSFLQSASAGFQFDS